VLSFVEEILLLLLDDTEGQFVEIPVAAFNVVVAGAALMDLALRNRIDSDLEHLLVIDPTPTGDEILDRVLAQAAAALEELGVTEWVDRIAGDAEAYKRLALDRLVARGILRAVGSRWLWVFRTRRYPVVDNREPREVKARLRELVLGDEIPDARDIVLICLVDACLLFGLVLRPGELQAAAPRIEQLRKMDLIGQAVATAVREIRLMIQSAGLGGLVEHI
jgi:Golgi phosphoprotein 3